MNYTARITVMPLKDLLDPQGKAVLGGLQSLGFSGIADVRIGKQIDLSLEASGEEEAQALASQAAKQLLANPVMEQFQVTILPGN
ncbi:MAG TPA: phosphoribosylformylglycinamidine synthase subunit PurS [Ferruginibacter sp.]|nr:phosphoribosylformylglycinamidine synthase subunit PurS [Ferruginibacter sp.]